jgi:DNA-binding MarR family transcriptional regulator
MTAPDRELSPPKDLPFGSPVPLLIQLLKLSSLVTTPMQDGVADPNGVSINELKIMMALGGEGAMAGHDIAEIMAIPPMNVSRALSSLQDRGWIEAVADPANRRRKPVQLSGDGRAAFGAMTPDVAAVAGYLLGTLSSDERATMARLSDKVTSRLADWIEQNHAGTRLAHPA